MATKKIAAKERQETPVLKKSSAKKSSSKISQIQSNKNGRYDIYSALNEHFGFDKFKERQEEAINSLFSGKDTFVIMPTGRRQKFMLSTSGLNAGRLRHHCESPHRVNEKPG
jgi:hypothetical protein